MHMACTACTVRAARGRIRPVLPAPSQSVVARALPEQVSEPHSQFGQADLPRRTYTIVTDP